MKRLTDWERRLTEVVAAGFLREFRYGEFDCALFVCECIEAQTGEDLSAGLRGTYSDKIGAALAIRRRCGGDLAILASSVAIMNDMPEIPPSMANQGDVVLRNTGVSLGICAGDMALFPDADCPGLAALSMDEVARAWKIG